MTTVLYCDHCGGSFDKSELYFIIGYPKAKKMKAGYKAKLSRDLCIKCHKKLFGAVK